MRMQSREVVVDGEACVLEGLMIDLSDQFSAMCDHHLRMADGFVMCYSITDYASFTDIRNHILPHLLGAIQLDESDVWQVPMVLAGCKCDLEDLRQVSEAEGALT